MPYEVTHHQRDETTQLAPASLGKIHPLNKAPIIEEDDIMICESGAILEYILDKDEQNRLRPAKGGREYYQFLEWLHFAEGSLALPVISSLFMQREERDGSQTMDTYIAKELNLDLAHIEATLANQAYFAGESFTAADIMMTISLEIAESINLLKDRPHTLNYIRRIQARDAYKKARQHG